MSGTRAVAIALVVLSSLLLRRVGPPGWRSLRIYSGTRRRRQRDAGGSAPALTPAAADRIAALEGLGFERLGETFVDLPDTGRRFAWQLRHPSATLYATVVPARTIGALVGIYSSWADGTWLSTMHPTGEPTDEPGFVVQVVRSDLPSAVAAHAARRDALAARHGAPRSVASVADVLVCDADYRSRYGGRTFARRTTALVAIAVLALAVTVAAFVLLATTAS